MLPFDAVIFDMDGTLVEQLLDFQAIRAELGIRQDDGILEAIDRMPPAQQTGAQRYLLDCELSAARKAVLMDGAFETIRRIHRSGIKTALLTRNSRQAMKLILEKFGKKNVTFDLTYSREDGPIKPDPDGIIRACGELEVSPGRTCCIGDFRYDIVAANAAGATSVLLVRGDYPRFAAEADFVIKNLYELPGILGI